MSGRAVSTATLDESRRHRVEPHAGQQPRRQACAGQCRLHRPPRNERKRDERRDALDRGRQSPRCVEHHRDAGAEPDVDGHGHRCGRRAGHGRLSVAAEQQRHDVDQHRRRDGEHAGPRSRPRSAASCGPRPPIRTPRQRREPHQLGHGFPGRQCQRCRRGLDQRHRDAEPDPDRQRRGPRRRAGDASVLSGRAATTATPGAMSPHRVEPRARTAASSASVSG